MPPRKSTPPPTSAQLEAALETIREVEEALGSGRTPRAAKQLREAARGLEAAGEVEAAVRAYGVLARLEVERGSAEQALPPARAALRVARADGTPRPLALSLIPLARLRSLLGEHAAALRLANEGVHEAWASDDAPLFHEALRAAAIIAWEAGDALNALSRLEEARDKAPDAAHRRDLDRLRAVILAQCGCPTTAMKELTELVKAEEQPERLIPLLMARGWTWCSLGKPDTAARDFRKARRLAKDAEARGYEIEAGAALAAADAQRSGASNAALAAKAAALAERTQRQASRHRDARLARVLELLRQGGKTPTIREAAEALVQLAKKSDSLELVNACVTEVQRLNGQPTDAPAYGCPLPLPLVLD